MHRWCLLNLTVQGFSLNLTVRGVSHKHCLLTFFISAGYLYTFDKGSEFRDYESFLLWSCPFSYQR